MVLANGYWYDVAKRFYVICLVFVSMLLIAVPAAYGAGPAPADAAKTADNALESFKSRHQGDAAKWGLTAEELQNLALGNGYHVMTWYPDKHKSDTNPDLVIAPYDSGDQWVFMAISAGNPVLFVYVVNTPKGWIEARVQRVTPQQSSSLADAMALLKAQGMTSHDEPVYFTFRGYSFWYLHGNGKAFMYPTLADDHPAMTALGIDRKHIHPAETVLQKLADMPVPKDELGLAGGGGPVSENRTRSVALWSLAALLLSGGAWYLIRRRRLGRSAE